MSFAGVSINPECRTNYETMSRGVNRLNKEIFFYNVKTVLKVIGVAVISLAIGLSLTVPAGYCLEMGTITSIAGSALLTLAGCFGSGIFLLHQLNILEDSARNKFWEITEKMKVNLYKFTYEVKIAFLIEATKITGKTFISYYKIDSLEQVNQRYPSMDESRKEVRSSGCKDRLNFLSQYFPERHESILVQNLRDSYSLVTIYR